MVPRIGTEFAGYRIVALLGRGGMSIVYRAENPRLGTTVALKVLAPELAKDESFRERFVAESGMAVNLHHPNIITIYDAGEEDGSLYIVMRYVPSDLKKVFDAEGAVPPARLVAILEQVAGALDAAHAGKLIHRDVKPANILLDGGGPENLELACRPTSALRSGRTRTRSSPPPEGSSARSSTPRRRTSRSGRRRPRRPLLARLCRVRGPDRFAAVRGSKA